MLTVEMSSQTQQAVCDSRGHICIHQRSSVCACRWEWRSRGYSVLELSVIIDVMLSARSDISQRVVLTAESCKSPSHDFCLEDPELKNRVVVDVNVYDSLAGFGIDQHTSDSGDSR
jgi:hypothetical protein